MLVATHNMMDGIHLGSLLRVYTALAQRERPAFVGALCLQENHSGHAAQVAAALGPPHRAHVSPGAPRLALVYDSARVSFQAETVVQLPRLSVVPLWQRLYTSSTPEQKVGVVYRLEVDAGATGGPPRPLVVSNFHLDSAGTNAHRAQQLRAVHAAHRAEALALGGPGAPAPGVLCGDTNCFSFHRPLAGRALRRMLRPLQTDLGMRDVGAASDWPTHYFARADEPKVGQRIAVLFGTLGVDFPCRYDVVCTSLPVVSQGQEHVAGSDHDLVWAAVRVDGGWPPGGDAEGGWPSGGHTEGTEQGAGGAKASAE